MIDTSVKYVSAQTRVKVLRIAATAMPFARSSQDQAQRWLRALRTHGDAAGLLTSLGITDEPPRAAEGEPLSAGAPRRNAIATVSRHAVALARRRGASTIRTSDLLGAVLEVYGPYFERVLAEHGVSTSDVVDRLNADGLKDGSA